MDRKADPPVHDSNPGPGLKLGVRIVILSAVMKFAMMPLSIHSTRSMKKMQAMQPLVLELQKKYANDPMRQREELSKLYKTHGVNPAGGCLPLLLQMPIFFALYRVLENSVALRERDSYSG